VQSLGFVLQTIRSHQGRTMPLATVLAQNEQDQGSGAPVSGPAQPSRGAVARNRMEVRGVGQIASRAVGLAEDSDV
jgi:hypothetical protein